MIMSSRSAIIFQSFGASVTWLIKIVFWSGIVSILPAVCFLQKTGLKRQDKIDKTRLTKQN